jgi:hypothetical protein
MATLASYQTVSFTTSLAPTWAREVPAAGERWIEVDKALRGIARRRAGLDAEEARWLREAQALKIWKPLGMTNAQDYMERILGYSPKAAQDRMRVAEALAELPVLETALAKGELAFSAVRELCRVAKPETEAAWASAAKGKNLRQIETLVTGRSPGDLPDDPPSPDVRTHVVRFELSPETFAALRQARSILDSEHGTNLTDNDFITVLANVVIEGAVDLPAASDGEQAQSAAEVPSDDCRAVDARANGPTRGGHPPMTRAKYQVAVTVCERCKQGWQLGAGAAIAIGPAAVARAECHAQHIGSLDAAVPERASQDISPAVARLVWRRDEGRCQTPGCRSSRALENHHIVPRSEGGGHEPANLRLTCSACHHAQHDGRLAIAHDGRRVDVHTAELAIDAPRSTIDAAIIRAQTKDALVQLGWKPAIARAATDAAIAALGPDAPLERMVREALQQCATLHHA